MHEHPPDPLQDPEHPPDPLQDPEHPPETPEEPLETVLEEDAASPPEEVSETSGESVSPELAELLAAFADYGTYGEEWRARAKAGAPLDADEQRMWIEEQMWEDANLPLVLWLEKHVGRTVATIRQLECVDGTVIPFDTHFSVRSRFRDRLLGESTNLCVSLRLEWIRIVKVAPPRKKTRHRDRDVDYHPVREAPAPDSIEAVSRLLERAANMRTST